MKIEFDKQDFVGIMESIDVAQNLIWEVINNFDNTTTQTIKDKLRFIAAEIDKASYRLSHDGEK